MRFVVAIGLLFGLAAVADAGCWHWRRCRVVVVQPVPVQPVDIQAIAAPQPFIVAPTPAPVCVGGQCTIVRRHYATPVRDALFGRYRAVWIPNSCENGNCTPNPDPGDSVVAPRDASTE